jgi:alginate O-acetyltransferase complex protein AlgI
LRFVDVTFIFLFLPSVFAVYFLIVGFGSLSPRLTAWASIVSTGVLLGASIHFVAEGGFASLIATMAIFAFSAAVVLEVVRTRQGSWWLLAVLTVAVCLLTFVRSARAEVAVVSAGLAVVTCNAIAFMLDVYRGEASTARPLAAALYLIQFPVLPAGPILRYRDFAGQLEHRNVGLGPFTYGVRRFVIGFVKVAVVAQALSGPADRIFATAPARLSTDAAWLGAIFFSLQIYFQFSGYSDLAIGLGRMFGFRFPENFRRPYTADSVRDFWRRWNVTLITWLRDYLYLPIAGRDNPSPRLYLNIVLGFVLVGLWHGGGGNVAVWALYSGFWLAIEALGLGVRINRLPAPLRHAYLLLVVVVGWVIFRTESLPRAGIFLATMLGVSGLDAYTAGRYLTTPIWLALVLAVIGAGPMVPAISRWRVSLDVAATSILMMFSATGIFIWTAGALLVQAIRPRPRR